MRVELIYIILLFIIYRTIFHIADFSINTPIYGLFIILLFFYYITDNLKFNAKAKCKSVYINGIIFLIFLFFYKKPYIFVAFLIFTVCQIILKRIFQKISLSKEERYDSGIISIRSGIKLFLDTASVFWGIFLSFAIKYDNWKLYLKKEYILIYMSIFLLGYVYKKISEKSWSYTNILDILNLISLNVITAVVFTFFIYFSKNIIYLSSVIFLTVLISLALQLFGRYIFRCQRYYKVSKKNGVLKKRAIIYGAGEAGAILARESLTSNSFPYEIIGFVDDDFKKVGSEIYKVKVLGTMKAIEKIIENEKIEEVLLALPSIKGEKIRKIVEQIQKLPNVKVKTVPGIPEILEGKELANQLRNVRIEDLLGRDEICINDTGIRSLIEGKAIFVTGGAGSIGSELARQIAKYNPKQLVAIDINENDIYFLELELHRVFPNLKFVSEICNIREKEKLEFLSNFIKSKNILKTILKYPLYLLVQMINLNKYIEKTDKLSQKYGYENSKYVDCVGWELSDKRILRKDVENLELHVFESDYFLIPSSYDKLLKIFYNDYMKLPSKEGRIGHHFYKVYKK